MDRSATPSQNLSAFIHEADVKLHALSERAARAADESGLAIYFGLKDLEEKWGQAQDKLLTQVERLRELEEKAQTASDTARVKAHLAKADAIDAANEVRSRLKGIETRIHALKVKAESETGQVLGKLGNACNELRSRLDGAR